MSDIVITAGSVVRSTGAIVDTSRVAGEAVTAGQVVYRKAADDKWWLSRSASTGTEAEAQTIGIALHAASANQPLAIQTGGLLTIGATIAAGVFYYTSNNYGGIAPIADIGSSDWVTIIGYGNSTSVLYVNPIITGKQLA